MKEKYQDKEYKEEICSVITATVESFIESVSKVAKTNHDIINAMAVFNIAVLKFATNDDPDKEDTALECLIEVMKNKQFV